MFAFGIGKLGGWLNAWRWTSAAPLLWLGAWVSHVFGTPLDQGILASARCLRLRWRFW